MSTFKDIGRTSEMRHLGTQFREMKALRYKQALDMQRAVRDKAVFDLDVKLKSLQIENERVELEKKKQLVTPSISVNRFKTELLRNKTTHPYYADVVKRVDFVISQYPSSSGLIAPVVKGKILKDLAEDSNLKTMKISAYQREVDDINFLLTHKSRPKDEALGAKYDKISSFYPKKAEELTVMRDELDIRLEQALGKQYETSREKKVKIEEEVRKEQKASSEDKLKVLKVQRDTLIKQMVEQYKAGGGKELDFMEMTALGEDQLKTYLENQAKPKIDRVAEPYRSRILKLMDQLHKVSGQITGYNVLTETTKKELTANIAIEYLKKANGNKQKAREMARKDGYNI